MAFGHVTEVHQKVLILITKFITQTQEFFYVEKDVRIKHASSNFWLYLYHME